MQRNFRVFVGHALALRAFVRPFDGVVLYSLPSDFDLLVLPFDDDLQDRLHGHFGTGDWPDNQGVTLSTTDQAYAAECSQHGALAYLQCDEYDDIALQSAAVWHLGRLILGPVTLDMKSAGASRSPSLRPFNVALRALGLVVPRPGDEFSQSGLDHFSSNGDIHSMARPIRG